MTHNIQHLLSVTWNHMKAMAHESWFVRYYLVECRRNGVQAYLKVFPNAQYQSAKASASRLLKKQSVIDAMRKKLEKLSQVGEC